MANATSASLKLTVQQTGENSGTWGQFTNTNLLILEQAIGGYAAQALNATTGATLLFSNGVFSSLKNLIKFGYSLFDNKKIKQYKNILINKKFIHVVIAPSWGDNSIFEKIGIDLVTLLIKAKFKNKYKNITI